VIAYSLNGDAEREKPTGETETKNESISKDFLPRITRMGTDIERQRGSFKVFNIWFLIREISVIRG